MKYLLFSLIVLIGCCDHDQSKSDLTAISLRYHKFETRCSKIANTLKIHTFEIEKEDSYLNNDAGFICSVMTNHGSRVRLSEEEIRNISFYLEVIK